ncbi:MAG: S1/P1 nuclease [Balneola sp.]
MKKILASTIIFTFLFSLTINPTAGISWNSTGHRVIAAIAWDNLTPAARTQIMSILKAAPEDSDLKDLYDADSENADKYYFMNASYWPDIVRDRDEEARYEKYHKGTWHYIGSYWKQTEDGPVTTDGFVDEEHIVERIELFRKTLNDPSVSKAEKAVQIAWILHLIGDIHNPLHNTSRVTDETPDGDLGGNAFRLGDTWPSNLHAYWDGIIDFSDPKPENTSEFDYYMEQVNKITEEHPLDDYTEFITNQDVSEWNEEGKYITMHNVYPADLKQNELPSEEYQNKAYELAQQGMAVAGYRMATFLNEIFGR